MERIETKQIEAHIPGLNYDPSISVRSVQTERDDGSESEDILNQVIDFNQLQNKDE